LYYDKLKQVSHFLFYYINQIYDDKIPMLVYKHQIYHRMKLFPVPSLSTAVLNEVISLSNLGLIATNPFSSFILQWARISLCSVEK
jgi:hypothetical protein